MNRREILRSASAAALAAVAGCLGLPPAQARGWNSWSLPLKSAKLATTYDVFAKVDDTGAMRLWAQPWKDGQRLMPIRFIRDADAAFNAKPIPNGPAAGEAFYAGTVYYDPYPGEVRTVRKATGGYVLVADDPDIEFSPA